VSQNGAEGPYRMVGDPTEGALVVAAAKAGLSREDGEKRWPRLTEIPFDSSRKRMTTVHRVPRAASPGGPVLPTSIRHAHYVAFVKGAPDVILDLSDRVLESGEQRPATAEDRRAVLDAVDSMARQALRVLGVAYRPLDSLPDPEAIDVEQGLVFVGLMGMIDPARPEVRGAIEVARGAGLRSVMVTGDYRDTATAIASEIGLLRPGGRVVTGQELERLSVEELAGIADDVDVYARVSPEHKVKIVEALKARGHVVAMTGDGVNDAPALKRANIGVAMGVTGTDVAKSTGDMVLTDDNFASIVSAVEEGRTIYSNIRKFVFYLISCNVVEILIVFLAMLGGLPPPFKPIQLLWLNLVTDGAPALALGLEKGDPDVMQRPPRNPAEPIIDWEMRVGTAVQAVVKTGSVLAAYAWALARFPDTLGAAQTVAFITLVISELLRAYTSRSEHHSVFAVGLFSNRWMVWATGASLVLLLLVAYVPFLQPVFGTVSLGPTEWAVILALSLVSPIAAELTKVFVRRKAAAASTTEG
jgi:P-type Ca2+ transporter type 2C